MKDIDFNTLPTFNTTTSSWSTDNVERNIETYVCVNFFGYPQRYKRKLTIGKKYESDVIRTIDADKFIYIFNDKGDYSNYRLAMFKTVTEVRNERLETLLNK